MASSFEKSVKGATKHKCAAPKAKYVEHILIATHAGEAGIAEVFRALNIRLRESAWTTVFKALIVVHYMIREGEQDVTLKYLKRNPRVISLQHYSDAQIQGRNIRNYSTYLTARAEAYGEIRTDFVRSGEGRLRKLTVEKGLLREVECVQVQIRALLRCQFADMDIDNEITLLAFRLLVSDLLVLFHVVNEGVINVLEHYFEMSRYDAERALEIYKVFTKQTVDVVDYLQQARQVEPSTRLQVPNIKHAPTSLTSSLEEYLHDPDFDINRRQYLAAQQAKKNPLKEQPKASVLEPRGQNEASTAAESTSTTTNETLKIAPDLIDFFESIESDQTPMFTVQTTPQIQSYGLGINPNVLNAQPMPFMATGSNFGPGAQPSPAILPPQFQSPEIYQAPGMPQAPIQQPLISNFTGAGFGGYSSQGQTPVVSIPSMPLPSMAPFGQPTISPIMNPPATLQISNQTGTNPFRQSMISPSLGNPSTTTPQQKSTNPFARNTSQPIPHAAEENPTLNVPQQQLGRSLTVSNTGTNPFARTVSPQMTSAATSLSPLTATPTGTNPFRASAMIQQQQAQQIAQMNGNFSGQTGTMGGLENIETLPVFPRQQPPGQTQWGQ